jgi:hypothetical protein
MGCTKIVYSVDGRGIKYWMSTYLVCHNILMNYQAGI